VIYALARGRRSLARSFALCRFARLTFRDAFI
jgi:hypothetical protein